MAISQELENDARELSEAIGLEVRLAEEGDQVLIHVLGVPLPQEVFRLGSTDVLFKTDYQYPYSSMDMFWTDVEVVKADGAVPEGAGGIETYLGRKWRRFSWHRNGVWSPVGNPLLHHYAFMESRWAAEKTK